MTTANGKKSTNHTDAINAGVPIKGSTMNMQSSQANVCNANSTREEVVLNFGGHDWLHNFLGVQRDQD